MLDAADLLTLGEQILLLLCFFRTINNTSDAPRSPMLNIDPPGEPSAATDMDSAPHGPTQSVKSELSNTP
jgi:hypothetical protein